MDTRKNKGISGAGLLVLVVFLFAVLWFTNMFENQSDRLTWSEFQTLVTGDNVDSISVIQNKNVPTGHVEIKLKKEDKDGKQVRYLYVSDINEVQDYLKEKNAVRIASIDIGGGTTDVMVCEYSRDPDAHIVVLSPDPLFWEGFNLAGDDIVKSIVERVVLPPIAEYAREQGCTSTFECMNFLFGPHLGTQNGTMQQLQLMFSTQVAYPWVFWITCGKTGMLVSTPSMISTRTISMQIR